ncbi:MAG TPA: hypothetical protein VFF00_07900 [Candidatus Elarobacter sp.]|nr:hypothetical protein [Candidatus Elarobacter sp.]
MAYTATVHAERVVDCPFSVAHEYASDYLRDAERGGDGAVLRAGPFWRVVAVGFGSRSDTVDQGRPNEEIVLRWNARTRLLPDFAGTLRFRIDAGSARLLLDGTYVPPGGVAGALFDRILGNRIADATARDLLERIGNELTERERTWRARHDEHGTA